MSKRTEQLEAIRAFEFHGVSLGDSEDDIEQYFEEFDCDDKASDAKAGVYIYNVIAPGVDFAKLFFFNGNLYTIRLIYGMDRINAMGDWTAIADRLVGRFGKADAVSDQDSEHIAEMRWNFDEADREIVLSVFERFAMVSFSDTNEALAAYNQIKRQADLGF